MSFFNLFKKKKKEQPIEELKWNKMWDLWAEEKASSPYAELMTYESEINNGGHMQFFDNVSNTSDLPQVISVLYTILNGVLKQNLVTAYNAYLEYEGNDDQEDKLNEILDDCDNVFYENESEIEQILKAITPFNAGKKKEQVLVLLKKWFPKMENFNSQLKKYQVTITDLLEENRKLEERAKAGEKGSVTIIFQEIGKTTIELGR